MSDYLLRGIPFQIQKRVQRLANSENLSINQALIRLVSEALKVREEKEEGEKRRSDVFRRIDEQREKLYRKYGMMEDSTKLIREDRDSR